MKAARVCLQITLGIAIAATFAIGCLSLMNPHTFNIDNPIAYLLSGTLCIVYTAIFFWKGVRPFERIFLVSELCIFAIILAVHAFVAYPSGTDTVYLNLIVSSLLVIAVLGGLWWSTFRNLSARRQWIKLIGLLLLFSPVHILAIGGILYPGTYTLMREFQYATSEKSKIISNYSEKEIRWDRFPEPVGMRIEFDFAFPLSDHSGLSRPRVWMGPRKKISRRELGAMDLTSSFPYTLDGYFPSILFQNYFADREKLKILAPVVEDSNIKLNSEGETHIAYDLFPGSLLYNQAGQSVCLKTAYFTVAEENSAPGYHSGESLSAFWFTFSGLDLGDLLSDVMRRHSALQDNPERWQKMHQMLDPAELTKAGYLPCALNTPEAPENDAYRGQQCYCTPEAEGASFGAVKKQQAFDEKLLEKLRTMIPPGLDPLSEAWSSGR
jgi:hypothetical protein